MEIGKNENTLKQYKNVTLITLLENTKSLVLVTIDI